MDEKTSGSSRIPGSVIFVAILNFLSAALFLLLILGAIGALVFGNFVGVYEYFLRQVSERYPQINISFGLNFLFGLVLAVGLLFFTLFLFIGAGLLKGKRIAWYLQIVSSVLGLFNYPLGTVLSAAILVFFFQNSVRSFFKV
ncbi:MAG: hypothetical protein HY593_06025 [Candidatus Omnitrophica bacterium]|nr:hypothetical protein [Candidatus Omnitrophota bacterium]